MRQEEFWLIPFNSTQQAIRAEQVALRENIRASLIPIPREIKADCGLALRLALADKDRAVAVLQESNVPVESLYLVKTGPHKTVTPWEV